MMKARSEQVEFQRNELICCILGVLPQQRIISMQQPQFKLPKWSLTVTIPSTNRSCRVASMERNAKANQLAAMLKVYLYLVTSQSSRHSLFFSETWRRGPWERGWCFLFYAGMGRTEKARFFKVKVFLIFSNGRVNLVLEFGKDRFRHGL